MEYKYHPIIKHLIYFILSYLFLRNQKLMPNDILLINSVILTLFIIILDHVFISGHITPFDSLKNDDYIDEDEVKKIKKKLKKEKLKNKKIKSDGELIDELTSDKEIEKQINRILDEDDKSTENISTNSKECVTTQQHDRNTEKFEDFIGNLDNIETFNQSSTSTIMQDASNDYESFNILGYNE